MKTIVRWVVIGAATLTAGIAVGSYAPPLREWGARPAEVQASRNPAPKCLEAMVYLPLNDNSGKPFSEEAWQKALEVLVVPFGGATLGTPQEGCWVDARGRVCREQVRPIIISFAPERLAEFRAAVRDVGRCLSQEAMYVRFEEPRVEIVPTGSP
jgi:hypothetical protein